MENQNLVSSLIFGWGAKLHAGFREFSFKA